MNIEEAKEQLNSLIEAWQLNEADLNQTDIDAIKCLLEENKQLKQLNKIVYVDKSKNIVDELENWLKEEKQLHLDYKYRVYTEEELREFIGK